MGESVIFKNKAIYWSRSAGALIVEDSKTWNEPITFAAGTALGGGAQVILNKNGDCSFSGHLHHSGYSPYNFTIIAVVVTPFRKDLFFSAQGTYPEGTGPNLWGSPDRNHDWNETVNNADVRDNWVQVNLATCKFDKSATDIFASDLQAAITDIAQAAAEAAVIAVIALI